MAYLKNVYKMPGVVEVEEYHTDHYRPPSEPRRKRQKQTPEQMEKRNHRQKVKKCRRLLRNNFHPGDYYGTLTYRKEDRPVDMKECQKDLRNLLRQLRKEYRKRDTDLKWIANIEVGPRGAWHIHIVLNELAADGVPLTDGLIRKLWSHGHADAKSLYADGRFADLAAYLVKDSKSDPEKIKESKYSHSRNLKMPKKEVHRYIRRKTWKQIKPPKGWYLDEMSIVEIVNPVTGWPYRSYTLLRGGPCTRQTST